jgi:hypothetical protein
MKTEGRGSSGGTLELRLNSRRRSGKRGEGHGKDIGGSRVGRGRDDGVDYRDKKKGGQRVGERRE